MPESDTPDPSDPADYPWHEVEDLELFRQPAWTDRLVKGMPVYDVGTSREDPLSQAKVADLLRQNTQPILKRLKNLERELCEMFVGKDEIIRMVFVCAIAQQPMLLIGPPGSAKSRIITRFCEGLDIGRAGEENALQTCFQYLLHSFTEPDEILGVLDLEAYQKEKKFRRFRKGSITEADVIFLDEVLKANSAILNALLTIINERRVYEGGVAEKAKARLIFGASNNTPTPRQLEELRAFYERFIIRMESPYVPLEFRQGGPSPERRELLRRGWQAEVRELRGGYDPAASRITRVACLNDILFCNRAVTELWGGADLENVEIKGIVNQYHELVTALAGGNTPAALIDDRKFIRLFLVVRAHALFANNTAPQIRDLCVLKHIWDDLNSKVTVANAVNEYIKRVG